MCQSTQWRTIIASDCPNMCGFCLLGGCIDAAVDCASQPTVCVTKGLESFVAVSLVPRWKEIEGLGQLSANMWTVLFLDHLLFSHFRKLYLWKQQRELCQLDQERVLYFELLHNSPEDVLLWQWMWTLHWKVVTWRLVLVYSV